MTDAAERDEGLSAGELEAALEAFDPDIDWGGPPRLAMADALRAAKQAREAGSRRLLRPSEHREPGAGELREALARLIKLRKSVETDVRSAHSGRGNGASQWMREDDSDFRKDLREAFDAAEAALQRTGGSNG